MTAWTTWTTQHHTVASGTETIREGRPYTLATRQWWGQVFPPDASQTGQWHDTATGSRQTAALADSYTIHQHRGNHDG